ncbi:hypothetical protein HYDPIDRAFT_112128 [Hydnomerulius pinastri MD-312]|uniref:Unplaced genomic scaffold scaffold_13, whole genome shotgun sequence n=1 Tax=Hydnomerulius pinastri MD-312 TaxID=994086 RepID=A0A0C9W0D8_9AGAM|nr:hypothetical protein HYDPIDRAFT_112128 [Hydnomerulius pinastri MD-312]
MSKQVTYCFVEESFSGTLTVRPGDTLASVRKRVLGATRSKVVDSWGDKEDKGETYVHNNPESVLIVSDQHGFSTSRDNKKTVSEMCKDTLIALVPSQSKDRQLPVHLAVQIPYNQHSPLLEKMKHHKNGNESTTRNSTAQDEVEDPSQKFFEMMDKMQKEMDAMKNVHAQSQRNSDAAIKQLEEDRTVDRKRIQVLEESIREKEGTVDKGRTQMLEATIKELEKELTINMVRVEDMEKEITVHKSRIQTLEGSVRAVEKGLTVDKASINTLKEQVNSHRVHPNKLDDTNAQPGSKWEKMDDELQEFRDVQNDIARWIYTKDVTALDRIKARQLLRAAQEMLAVAIGVSEPRYGAWRAWRDALGPSQVLSERVAKAHQLLCATPVQLNEKTRKFVSSEDGMRLVSEYHDHSPIRAMGNSATHPSPVSIKSFNDTVKRHEKVAGLDALMLFACVGL